MAEPRPARSSATLTQADAGRRPPRRTTRPRRAAATSSARSRPCSRRAPSCSRDSVDIDVFGIDARRARRRRAAVHRARRPHPRCARLGGRQGARRADSASSSSRCSRTPTSDDATPPREIIVPDLPDDADGARDVARRAARAAARCGCAPRSAATRPRCSRRRRQNAKQSLMLYKTRRSADFTARSQALERHPGGARHGRGAAADGVLRRLAPRAAPTSSRRWSSSRTACRARTQYRRFSDPGVDRRHRLDLPGAHAAGSPTCDARTPSADAGESAASATTTAPDGREAQAQVRLPPGPAHRRRRPAPGRRGRSARSTSRASTTSSSAASPSGSRRSGCPTRTSRSSCRATARRCSCSSASATRRTASRSRYQRQKRKRDIALACSPRSRASGRRV